MQPRSSRTHAGRYTPGTGPLHCGVLNNGQPYHMLLQWGGDVPARLFGPSDGLCQRVRPRIAAWNTPTMREVSRSRSATPPQRGPAAEPHPTRRVPSHHARAHWGCHQRGLSGNRTATQRRFRHERQSAPSDIDKTVPTYTQGAVTLDAYAQLRAPTPSVVRGDQRKEHFLGNHFGTGYHGAPPLTLRWGMTVLRTTRATTRPPGSEDLTNLRSPTEARHLSRPLERELDLNCPGSTDLMIRHPLPRRRQPTPSPRGRRTAGTAPIPVRCSIPPVRLRGRRTATTPSALAQMRPSLPARGQLLVRVPRVDGPVPRGALTVSVPSSARAPRTPP